MLAALALWIFLNPGPLSAPPGNADVPTTECISHEDYASHGLLDEQAAVTSWTASHETVGWCGQPVTPVDGVLQAVDPEFVQSWLSLGGFAGGVEDNKSKLRAIKARDMPHHLKAFVIERGNTQRLFLKAGSPFSDEDNTALLFALESAWTSMLDDLGFRRDCVERAKRESGVRAMGKFASLSREFRELFRRIRKLSGRTNSHAGYGIPSLKKARIDYYQALAQQWNAPGHVGSKAQEIAELVAQIEAVLEEMNLIFCGPGGCPVASPSAEAGR